ncbi:MAG: sulfotransferase [Flavobacteriales bacterium]|nr:sulfotransferase [Flavobacteriales bacterium]
MAQKRIIHIGFPKTGSTFLQRYFSAHPEIHHDRERFKNYVKTGLIDDQLARCDERFLFDILSEELLSIWPGDDSDLDQSRYNMNYDIKAKQIETATQLKRLFPDAKILIVVRGYQSLIPSLYSQYLFGGGTDSFKKVVRTEQHLTLTMYNYDCVIDIYRNLFGNENVLIMPFEFLNDNPEQYLKYLERFFGFSNMNFPSSKIHSSLNNYSVIVVRILNFLISIYLQVLPRKYRKKKFLDYLEWLNSFKEKLNHVLSFGKELIADERELRIEEFRMQSQLLKFEEGLEQYYCYYR